MAIRKPLVVIAGALRELPATDLIDEAPVCGFPDDANGAYLCTLTYNETTRTVTITPTGASFDVYCSGVKYTKAGAQSIVHGALQGGHFVYYDATGTLVTGQTPWDLLHTAPVCYVFWDSVNSKAIPFEERHHAWRDVYWHRNQHAAEGTKVISGFAASGYTLNNGATDAAVTFAIASGRADDEDIRIDTVALADGGPYNILERSGAAGDWRMTFDTLPYLRSGATLQYNQFTGATWQRTALAEDTFTNVYVFVATALPPASITPAPAGNAQYLIVPGQAVFATQALAAAESVSSLAWGSMPFQEIAPLYQVTLRFNASNPAAYSNTTRTAVVAFTRVVGTYASVTQAAQSNHGALVGLTDPGAHPASAISFTPTGGIATTDVQSAIAELDSELRLPAATASVDGYMTSAYASKLDGIASGATAYSHPANHPPSIITQDTNNRFVTDAEKATWNAKQAGGSYESPLTFSNGVSRSVNAISVTYGTLVNTVCQGNDSRLSDSRVASDVYSWAKAATKPTYNSTDVGLGNVTNVSRSHMWNNQGSGHASYSTFNSITDFGNWFMQNSAAGDAPQATQFYVSYQGLGGEYSGTQYGLMTAISRDAGVKYTWFRKMEGGTWGSWEKAAAGYADTAGSAPASDVYAWAKAATKPTYTYSEVGAQAPGAYITATSTDTLTNKTIQGTKEVKTAVVAADIDLSTGNMFTKTISGTITFTVSNIPATGTSASFILDLTNGGAFAITWWAGMKWAGGTAPTLTAAGRDVLGFFTHDGGTTWTGLVMGKDVK